LDIKGARDQLFAASLESFVEVRKELAAALASEGKKDDSRALKNVRRPSLSAWATNQVVRQALDESHAFFAASDALRHDQHAMMSGQSDRASYQLCAEAFRNASSELGAAARAILAKGGRSGDPALVERILTNFRHAAASQERREDLLGGELENDIAPGEDDLASSFGAMAGGAPPPSRGPAPEGRPNRSEEARRAREEQLRAQKEELVRRLQSARAEETTAGQHALDAESRATRARWACDEARAKLDEVDAAAVRARQEWRDAELVAQRATREASEARTAHERAREKRAAIEQKAGDPKPG
jgi:hypothetical protein